GGGGARARDVGFECFLVDAGGEGLERVAQAARRDPDPDEVFVRGAAQRKATTLCRDCPVMYECLADALDNRVEFGVWGGMTERQRRALLKQYPDVISWADFFRAHRRRQEREQQAG